ncbi:hypothetical protein D1F64_11955 [Breoghania sp. L-A4]|nr:hypothetical protein D1F64_11955 [Breoghania sp. L-A4]
MALGVALIASGLFGPRAMAFDPTGSDVADTFLKGLESGGAQDLSVGSVEQTGETVVINMLAATMRQRGEEMSLEAEAIAFTDASVDATGRIKAGAMAARNVSMKTDTATFFAARTAATNVILVRPRDMGAVAAPIDAIGYESLDITDVRVSTEDEGTVPIARIFSTLERSGKAPPTKGTFQIEGIELDPAQLDDEQAKKTLAELGYDMLNLSMKASFEWDVLNSRAILENFEISGDAIGTLSLSASFGGVTPDVVAKLKQQSHADGELMALAQQITVESIDLRFDNDTIVERVLDRQAEEANMERAAFVERLNSSLPRILTLLQNPPFQEKIAAALGTFLSAPESLQITANPAQALTVGSIAGTAMMAPMAVPLLLGLDIKANE